MTEISLPKSQLMGHVPCLYSSIIIFPTILKNTPCLHLKAFENLKLPIVQTNQTFRFYRMLLNTEMSGYNRSIYM